MSNSKYTDLMDMHTHSIHSFDGNHSCDALCESAVEKGFRAIAITDHCDIDGEDIDIDKLCRNQLKDIVSAQKKYKGRLAVISGIEIGQGIYRKEKTDYLLDKYRYDFVLGSIHNLEGMEDFYFLDYSQYDIDELLTRYFTDLIKLVEWGRFDSLAHLTYPLRYIAAREKINVDMSRYSKLTDEILSLLAKNKKSLEINTSGLFMEMQNTLPDISYIKRFRELGGEFVTIGSDSHYAEKVGQGIIQGMDTAKQAGFEYITVYRHHKPVKIKIR